jgi:TP901 family phage tail tape measure protein
MAFSLVIGGMVADSFRTAIGTTMGGIDRVGKGLGDLQTSWAQVGAAIGAGSGIGKLVSVAGDFEHKLAQAGVTADLTAAQVAGLRDKIRGLAVPAETNQSMDQLLGAYTALVSAGLGHGQAVESLRALGRTATASGSNIEDLAKTAFQLVDTLGVAPENLSAELDRLAFAGKKGAFELKDMAQHFPALAAQAKELGLTGTEAVATLASALQMAKKGAADPAEAANNMKNFLMKITSKEARQNFQKFGVDVTKTLKEAMEKGENPFEAVVRMIDKALGTDKNTRKNRLGELFGDMQVQQFLVPVLGNIKGLEQLTAEIKEAKGTVDADFKTMMATFKESTAGLGNAIGSLGESIGKSFLPILTGAATAITPLVQGLADLANKAPATTFALTGLAAGALAIGPALTGIRIGMALMSTSVIGNFVTAIRAGYGVMTAFNLVLAANPIGAVVAAVGLLVAAGTLLYDNWEPVSAFFKGLWEDLGKVWDTVGKIGSAIGKGFGKLIGLDGTEGKSLPEGFGGMFGGNTDDARERRYRERLAALKDPERLNRSTEALAAAGAGMSPGAPLGPVGAAGAAGKVQVQVDFANAPKGTRVAARSDSDDIGLAANLGFAMGGP